MYIVLEGPDCVGKTTLAKELSSLIPDSICTHHPGSTIAGQTLRNIVKEPDKWGFKLSPLSAQLLMIADNIEFTNKILKPSLESNQTVIADRHNFISSLIYGATEGINVNSLIQILSAIEMIRADYLFMLYLDWEEYLHRKQSRNDVNQDRFEDQGSSFAKKIHVAYDQLFTSGIVKHFVNSFVNLDNIHYINANATTAEMADQIISIITK